MTLRVVYFGSSQNVFSQRFYEALRQTPCEIVAVVDVPPAKRSSTNPTNGRGSSNYPRMPPGAAYRCTSRTNPNVPEFVAAMRSLRPDLFLAVGYMFRLKAEILAVPRIVSANVHASLLPAYRGRSPVFWALRHGEPLQRPEHPLDGRPIGYGRSAVSGPRAHAQGRHGCLAVRSHHRQRREAGAATDRRRRARPAAAKIPSRRAPARIFRRQRRPISASIGRAAPKNCGVGSSLPRANASSTFAGKRVFFLRRKTRCKSANRPRREHCSRSASTGCTIATGDGALRIGMIRTSSGEPMPMPQFCRQIGADGRRLYRRLDRARSFAEGGLLMPLVPFQSIDGRRRSRRSMPSATLKVGIWNRCWRWPTRPRQRDRRSSWASAAST